VPSLALGTLIAALTCIGAPDASLQDAVAFTIPPPSLPGTIRQALPVAPDKVVRETRYFGTVTIDHTAHLTQRASCQNCHDPGPVGKIAFTPRTAHERCIGCHRSLERGPTSCRDCHVASPPSAAAATVAAIDGAEQPSEPPARATSLPFPPPPPRHGGVLADLSGERADPARGFQSAVQVGFASAGEEGFAIRVEARRDQLLFVQGVERVNGAGSRTLGLFGIGRAHPLDRGRWELFGLGLAGLDAVDGSSVALLPALGMRGGVRWLLRERLIDVMELSLAGIVDLTGGPPSAASVPRSYAITTLTVGMRLPSP
jgi:hypothetical protein